MSSLHNFFFLFIRKTSNKLIKKSSQNIKSEPSETSSIESPKLLKRASTFLKKKLSKSTINENIESEPVSPASKTSRRPSAISFGSVEHPRPYSPGASSIRSSIYDRVNKVKKSLSKSTIDENSDLDTFVSFDTFERSSRLSKSKSFIRRGSEILNISDVLNTSQKISKEPVADRNCPRDLFFMHLKLNELPADNKKTLSDSCKANIGKLKVEYDFGKAFGKFLEYIQIEMIDKPKKSQPLVDYVLKVLSTANSKFDVETR